MAAAEVHNCAFPVVTIEDVGRDWRCRKCGQRWELRGGTIFAWHDGEPEPEEREWLRWYEIH
jgi:hypothetical protein